MATTPVNRWEAWIGRQIVYIIISALSAGMWYTFDDTLAALVNWPELGHLSFWFVWPLSWWVRVMTPMPVLEREIKP